MNKQRRTQIKEAVIDTLKAYGKQLGLPVPIKAITKSFRNIRLIPYSTQMKRRNLSYEEMIDFAGTEDACTDYDAKAGVFVIYYNDVGPNKISSNRYRWNIAHELGHIALKHHQKHTGSRIFRNSIGKDLYRELEDEADMFAAYILVPHIVVSFVDADLDGPTIKKACRISGAAAGYRLVGIKNWRKHNSAERYDFTLLDCFYDFVEDNSSKPAVQDWLDAHRACPNCNTRIPKKNTKFCTTCGFQYIGHYEMEQKIMEYQGIITHENLHAIECPICHNTELTENGKYCMICGESLINICASEVFLQTSTCGDPLPGNARYCPYCGGETTFFKRGILESWDGVKYADLDSIDEPPF